MIDFRNTLTVIACLFLLLSCGQREKEQAKYSYRITGSVKDCVGCEVELWTPHSRDFDKIDSTFVKDGRFTFKGELPDSGFYQVNMKGPKAWVPVDLYLPADSIHIIIHSGNKIRTNKFYANDKMPSPLVHVSVTSSSSIQGEMEKYLLVRDSLWAKFFDDRELIVAKFSQTYDSGDPALVQQWADSVESMQYRFANYMSYAADLSIRQGASPEAALFAMIENRNDRMATERFREYFNALPASAQNSLEGNYIDNYLKDNEERNRNNQRFVGSRIRNLDLLGGTPQGEEVDETAIFKQNKLVRALPHGDAEVLHSLRAV